MSLYVYGALGYEMDTVYTFPFLRLYAFPPKGALDTFMHLYASTYPTLWLPDV